MLEVLPRASTSPALIETGDGRRWVMKFTGAGPGPFGVLTEYLALGIARRLAAPVPEAWPVLLPEGFPWMAGTDEFDAMLQRSWGWNLAVAFVPDARPAEPADLAPSPALAAIALADRFLQNMDRTARNPNLLVAADGIVAIDYDACLYLSRALGPPRPPATAQPPGHLLAGLPLPEPSAPPPLDMRALVDPAPPAWLDAAGVDRETLAAQLAASYAAWAAA